MSFVLGNIRHVQKDQGINAPGEPEIPRIVFEELIANALIHRDYFVSAPVRIFVFQDRVEIISPGQLPNNLTIENIKRGNSNIRNPILASFATKIVPYRGLGSGIIRSLKAYSDIEFEDDHDGNQFKVIIKRRPIEQIQNQ
jgi:ATP-dependent DNA helicase RecG